MGPGIRLPSTAQNTSSPDAFHHKFFICKLKFTQNGGGIIKFTFIEETYLSTKISDEENKNADDA